MTFSTRLPKAAIFAFAAPFLAVTATAQDECATASPIALDTPTPFDTAGATNNPADPAFGCGSASGLPRDIWFEFTAAADYTATIDTCGGTTGDTRLAVLDGGCGSLMTIACNDDSCSLRSSVDVPLTAGTQYFVRVSHWSSSTVAGILNVSGPPLPPWECVDADPITPDVPTFFDTTGASISSPDFSCTAGGSLTSPDVWLEFTASADYTATVSTCGTVNYDSKIEVYSGTCGALVSEACNDDFVGCAGFSSQLDVALVSGTQYFVRIGGWSTADVGSGTILVTGPPTAVANDECVGAIALADGVSEFFDSTLATNSAAAPAWTCGGVSSAALDIWYSITPLLDGSVTVDTFGSSFDTRLSVYEGSCGSLAQVACNDDSGGTFLSSITFAGTAGTTYSVRVAGFNAAAGLGQVNASFFESYPNDDCSGAIAVGLGSTLYTNVGAGDSGLEMSCAVGSSVGSTNDVWFTFTPTSSCTLVVDTLGSDFDTTIAAYIGDCTMLTEVACDDDFFGSASGFLSQMTFEATAGTTYYIQAGSWGGEQGNGSLNISIDDSPGIADLVCLGVPNSTGEAGTLRAEGSLFAADNDLTFEARCLPANQNGLLVNSSTAVTTVNNPGGSAGNLCIASFNMGRHPVTNTGAAGSVSFPVDTTSIPTNAGPSFLATAMLGDTWYFQFWYRDGATSSNFTSAVSVTFQ